MADKDVKVCPKCKGEGGFGVKGALSGFTWSTCWTCKGAKVVPK